MSTPTGMNETMKRDLRAHLVRLANEEPARQRAQRRTIALAASGGLVLALAGVTIGWNLGANNTATPPAADPVTEQPTDQIMGDGSDGGTQRIWYEFVGPSEVTVPTYTEELVVEATFTCHDAGFLTIGTEDPRTCQAGESFAVPVTLRTDTTTQLPVDAEPGQGWMFEVVFGGDGTRPAEPDSQEPRTLPDGRP